MTSERRSVVPRLWDGSADTVMDLPVVPAAPIVAATSVLPLRPGRSRASRGRYRGVPCWQGLATGSWWAMVPWPGAAHGARLIEAPTRDDLVNAIDRAFDPSPFG